jgi:hypothetical protein
LIFFAGIQQKNERLEAESTRNVTLIVSFTYATCKASPNALKEV